MTNPGAFHLVLNDGRQDQLIFTRDSLISNLEKFGDKPGPKITDVLQSHLLFTTCTYKPHVQIAMYYQKETLSGMHLLGNTIEFEWPNLGDLVYDCVLQLTLNADNVFTPNANLDDSARKPLIRWCDFPGERVCKNIEFSVNNTVLDSYDPDWAVMKRQFEMHPNKKNAYYKLIGQEVPETGYIKRTTTNHNINGSLENRVRVDVCKGLQTPSYNQQTTITLWIPLQFWFNTDIGRVFPAVAVPNAKKKFSFTLADATQLIGAVLDDREQNITSDSEMYTAVSQACTIDYSKLVVDSANLYMDYFFLNREIHDIYLQNISFTLIYLHREQIHTLTSNNDRFKLNQLQWPVPNLYIGVKWSDYDDSNASRRFKYLDRWHKFSYCDPKIHSIMHGVGGPHRYIEGGSEGMSLMTVVYTATQAYVEIAATWSGSPTVEVLELQPIGSVVTVHWYEAATTASTGFSFVVSNVTRDGTSNNIQLWTTGAIPNILSEPAYTNGLGTLESSVSPNSVNVTQALEVQHYNETPMMSNLAMSVHGIDMFNWHVGFLNNYIPFQFAHDTFMMPVDPGIAVVNWALMPNQYQPSGHLNFSRAREVYLTVGSNFIGDYTKTDSTRKYQASVIIKSNAMNYLLVSDGCASLRYST